MTPSSYLFIVGIFAAAVGCSSTSTSDAPQGGSEGDTSLTLPPRPEAPAPSSSSKSTPSSPTSAQGDAGAATDAAIEAGATKDASVDAKPNAPAKLAYGAACSSHDQCAGNLCLAFNGQLRCTKTCNDDDDCQNGDNCDGDIKVCDLD